MKELQIVYKNISELNPYENNPRFNDEAVEYVANSIKEFGFKNPIILDNNNVIICGHTRYKAAKQLEMENVPCIICSDLTPEQIKAFRLADNKVSEFSSWDYEKLEKELANIANIDMSIFDFEKAKIDVNDIDWNEIQDLDEVYEEPQKEMLCCPHCGHIDSKTHFRKVDKDISDENIS